MNATETRLREIAERENSIPKERFIRDRNCVYATVPTNPPKYFRGELQLANRFSLVVHGLNRESIGSTGCETLAEFITNAPSDIRWLLALIKKQREALEADALADKLFERAEAHREESIACGYDNDPTGSLAVTESYKAANAQALIATQLKKDALNFSPENL